MTLLAGCGSAANAGPGDASAADAPGDGASSADSAADPWAGAPPAVCKPAASWDGKGKIFKDITASSGIAEAGAAGIRLSTADLDGDLLPELFVRSMSNSGKRENFGSGARRLFLIKAKRTSAGDFQFSDITQSSGILLPRDATDGFGRQAHIVVYGDVNNDGNLDAFCGNSVPLDSKADLFPQDASELMLGDGNGHFSFAPGNAFAGSDLRRNLTSASFVDYDRDGFLDLWLGYATWGAPGKDTPSPDHLVRGDGSGLFTVVTTDEGLMTKPATTTAAIENGTAHRHTWGTAACDVNGDGWPDLLGVTYGRNFNSLWLNGSLGTSGARFDDLKGPTHFDRDDNDDWTSNWNAQCYCFDNPKAAECDKVPPPEVNCPQLKAAFGGFYRWNHSTDRKPYRLGGNTGSVACADLDRDGDLDFVFGTIVHPDVGPSSDPLRVALSDGAPIPTLTHLSEDVSGLGHHFPKGQGDDVGDMTLAVFDFDNDGRLDILVGGSDYPGTKAKLFQQQPDGKFLDVTQASGLHHPHAHGIAVADWDRDGDLDVALGHSLARCNLSPKECYKSEEVHVFANATAPSGNWLQVQLVGGPGSNRSAIGAVIRVTAGGATQTHEVGGGYGHFGLQHDLVAHFGLGAACTIDQLEVRWPDAAGTTQVWKNIRPGYLVRLSQGDAKPAYPLWK
ncbi:MAG: CRTAC1 family protein [Deltaproteobacteria bacterium]|nr:CRTAC1 family protein [Deltaproteobacteria bacterium]